jgi:hypothetical protein
MKNIFQKYKKYIFLFFFITLIRSPGFFNISTDSDFATYILVSNSYVHQLGLYDNIIEAKPFFNFFPYILVISLFGKNFFLIQLFGAIIIFSTCCIIIKIYQLLFNQKNYLIGYIYSFYTTYLVSAGLDFQPQLTGTFFYILALFLFLKLNSSINIKNLILGFSLGCAALTRQNFMISALVISIIFPVIFDERKINFLKKYLKNFTLISLGGVISFIIFFIPFAMKDFAKIFHIIFFSPSAILTNNNIFISSIYLIGHSLWLYKLDAKSIPSIIYYLISIIGFIYLIRKKEKNIIIFNLFFFSALLGIILTNLAHNQHMIQVAPFLCLYFIYFTEKISKSKTLKKIIFIFFLLFIIIFLIIDINSIKNNSNAKTFAWLFQYLHNNLKKNETIYINGVSNNLYWLIDRYPPISIAHQSNIEKNEFLKSIYGKEFDSSYFYKRIYHIKPNYLILDKELKKFFFNYIDLDDLKKFTSNYTLIKTFETTQTKYERLFRNKYKKTLLLNNAIYLYKKK